MPLRTPLSATSLALARAACLAVSAAMIALSIRTSLESNLFTEFGRLLAEPWMRATLVDFYFNILILSAWTAVRETRRSAAAWIVSFVLLGSIATAAYLYWQLRRLEPGDPLEKLFRRS